MLVAIHDLAVSRSMPTPRAFAGWRSLSRSGPTSDVPCRSTGTLVSIPCSTRKLSSCLALACSTSRTFDCDPHHLIVCVVIHLREPELGFRIPCLRDLAPCSERLSSYRAAIAFFALLPALPTMEWIPMHGCDPAHRFRAPLRHPAIDTPLPRQRPRSSEWSDRLSFTGAFRRREEFDPRCVRPTTATDTADTRTHASYGYRMRPSFLGAFDA